MSESKAKWESLVSKTNWEKGAVIEQWLNELDIGDSIPAYELLSESIGGITAMHVERLFRTHGRFGHIQAEFEGLRWSHFYAALDWDDAEMWLEGACQNKWSVSDMRKVRWEHGAVQTAESDGE